jgi:peptidoglycan/LPS O-acetylase OafA/YrhL
MIEVTRYVLALVVVLTHLQPLGMGRPGSIAVFAFYTLSGYLITRVLNERYGFNARSTAAFLLNRVLRLWPAYFIILVLTLIALWFLPLQDFFPLIRFPMTPGEIIGNVAILGQVTFDYVQGLPLAKPTVTSWSLSIEVFCYLLLAMYFARTPARLWAFVAIGAIAMGFSTWHCAVSADPSLYGSYCYQNRSGVLQAGFIPLAVGGLFYFHSRSLRRWINANWRTLIVLLVAAVTATFLSNAISATVGPYLGIGVMFCVLSVWNGQPGNSSQDFFGRASYHLFIGHMPIAAVLVIGLKLTQGSLFVFLAAVIVALALSLGLVPLERNINGLRQRIAKMRKPYGGGPLPAEPRQDVCRLYEHLPR